MFYFGEDRGAAVTEARAIRTLWRSLGAQGIREWPEGQPNRNAIRQALGLEVSVASPLVTGTPAAAATADAEQSATELIAATALTVKQAAALYVEARQAEQIGDRSKFDIKHRVGRGIEVLGKEDPLLQVDRERLTKFMQQWLNPCNASLQYAKHIVTAIKAFLTWASVHETIAWPMPAGFDALLMVKTDKPRNEAEREAAKAKAWGEDERHFEIAELRRIWKKSDRRMRACIMLGLNCAYYPVDMANLRISDVKGSRERWIQTIRSKTGVPWKHVLWPETVQALTAVRSSQGPYWFGKGARPIDRRNLARRWDELRDEAKVPDAPPMKFLRHTSTSPRVTGHGRRSPRSCESTRARTGTLMPRLSAGCVRCSGRFGRPRSCLTDRGF